MQLQKSPILIQNTGRILIEARITATGNNVPWTQYTLTRETLYIQAQYRIAMLLEVQNIALLLTLAR
jgi:hypothetical protein